MLNDLAVSPVTAATMVRSNANPTGVGSSQVAAQSDQGAAASPIPNPTLQLNPGLGLVVIQFRNETGAVTTSIPSERQLQAYQRWQTTHFGPAPHGMHVASIQAQGSPVSTASAVRATKA